MVVDRTSGTCRAALAAALAAPVMAALVAGCASGGAAGAPGLADGRSAAGPFQGRGFRIAAPGAGWSVDGTRPDAIAFSHHPGQAMQAPDVTPYVLTAGAQSHLDAALARQLRTDPSTATRAWLGPRLQAPRRDVVAFAASPAELNGARCASYAATQVDRFDPERIAPDHVEDQEYVQHGMLCAHPRIDGMVVQVFYNERFVRGRVPARRVGEEEMRKYFATVEWND